MFLLSNTAKMLLHMLFLRDDGYKELQMGTPPASVTAKQLRAHGLFSNEREVCWLYKPPQATMIAAENSHVNSQHCTVLTRSIVY